MKNVYMPLTIYVAMPVITDNRDVLNVCSTFTFIGKIHEEFIALVDVTGKTRGEDLATAIKAVITETTLPLNKLRGQCYDGAGRYTIANIKSWKYSSK